MLSGIKLFDLILYEESKLFIDNYEKERKGIIIPILQLNSSI